MDGLFLASNLLKRASTSALALVLYYLPILEERPLEKLKTSTRQVEGVTIVDLSGRITLGEASVVVRDVIKDLMGKGNKKIHHALTRILPAHQEPAEVLKPTRESGQQFGSLDPHGDMLPMARELLSQPPAKLKRPAKKRT